MRFSGVFAVSIILLAGCGTGTVSSPAPNVPVVTATTKPPIHGLVAMNQEGFNTNAALTPSNALTEPNTNANVYAASVIVVTWKQLQPTSGASFDSSAIDAGLSAITTYNTANPKHPLVGKLRVFAGINTPAWAMTLDGTPITNPSTGGVYPRYWTANYTAAWKSLQNLLAAKYDKMPLLAEVAVSGCSSSTAEPFVADLGTMAIPILKAAGYTDAQKKSCLSTMADQYSAWTSTPLDYTFNAFTSIDSGVGVVDSTVYPEQIMDAWRSQLGTARGIVANHGLQPTLLSNATAIYSEFQVLGPPLELQSYAPNVDWNATIALGLTYHPFEIEIWQTTQAGGQAVITLAQLQLWASEI